MPSAEQPDGWDPDEQERKVIAAPEGVLRGIPVGLGVQFEADSAIGALDGGQQIGRVGSPHQVQHVPGVGLDVEPPLALRRVCLVAADHVHVDHRAGGRHGHNRPGDVDVGPKQSVLLGAEADEDQAALGAPLGRRKDPCQFEQDRRSGPVVVGSRVDLPVAVGKMIVVRIQHDGLAAQGGISSLQDANDVIRLRRGPGLVDQADVRLERQTFGLRAEGAVDLVLNPSVVRHDLVRAGTRERQLGDENQLVIEHSGGAAQRVWRSRRRGGFPAWQHQDCDGAVGLRVEPLDSRRSVHGEAGSQEYAVRVPLLRLAIEDDDDLPLGIQTRIVVIAVFGGGDAITREDHRGGEGDIVLEGALKIGAARQRFPLPLMHQRDGAVSGVQRRRDQFELLGIP
jgi:hypothetical protein